MHHKIRIEEDQTVVIRPVERRREADTVADMIAAAFCLHRKDMGRFHEPHLAAGDRASVVIGIDDRLAEIGVAAEAADFADEPFSFTP